MQDKAVEVIHTPGIDIVYYFNQIINYFVSHFPYILSGSLSVGKVIIGYLVGLSIILSIMLLIGIVYCVERLKYIRRKEDEIYNAKVDTGYETIEKGKNNQEFKNKWNKVTLLVESENDSDWRQAIMEADIILSDLLIKLGYKGEGIGEQLKRVEKGDFNTLDQAWEAHKIRNAIAHEGSNYPLSKYEAHRIINMYQEVFKEFYDL